MACCTAGPGGWDLRWPAAVSAETCRVRGPAHAAPCWTCLPGARGGTHTLWPCATALRWATCAPSRERALCVLNSSLAPCPWLALRFSQLCGARDQQRRPQHAEVPLLSSWHASPLLPPAQKPALQAAPLLRAAESMAPHGWRPHDGHATAPRRRCHNAESRRWTAACALVGPRTSLELRSPGCRDRAQMGGVRALRGEGPADGSTARCTMLSLSARRRGFSSSKSCPPMSSVPFLARRDPARSFAALSLPGLILMMSLILVMVRAVLCDPP